MNDMEWGAIGMIETVVLQFAAEAWKAGEELSFFDRDGNSIDKEQWGFLTIEGKGDYSIVQTDSNNENFVHTMWLGFSRTSIRANSTFCTVVFHRYLNSSKGPHIDDVTYWSDEAEAIAGHTYTWKAVRYFNPIRFKFTTKLRRSKLGLRLFWLYAVKNT